MKTKCPRGKTLEPRAEREVNQDRCVRNWIDHPSHSLMHFLTHLPIVNTHIFPLALIMFSLRIYNLIINNKKLPTNRHHNFLIIISKKKLISYAFYTYFQLIKTNTQFHSISILLKLYSNSFRKHYALIHPQPQYC